MYHLESKGLNLSSYFCIHSSSTTSLVVILIIICNFTSSFIKILLFVPDNVMTANVMYIFFEGPKQ